MSTYAPDGWQLDIGTWGTDAQMDTTLHLTGDASVELKSTAVATRLVSSYYAPCEEGANYSVKAMLRASSIAAGNNVWVYIGYLDKDRVWLSGVSFLGTPLSSAGAWIEYAYQATAPANARFAFPYISKAAVAFSLYVDRLLLTRSVESNIIKDAAVIEAKIGALAVTSGKIADAAVISAKVANNELGAQHIVKNTSQRLRNSVFAEYKGTP